MRQVEFPPPETTTLYTPARYSEKAREERKLSGAPGDYKVIPGEKGERWTVTSMKTNEILYNGIGPVSVLRTKA